MSHKIVMSKMPEPIIDMARAMLPAGYELQVIDSSDPKFATAMLDADFFVRFVTIFQTLGSSLLEDADNVDYLTDVTVAPDAMVRWLGSWIGTDTIDPSLEDELQRRIVASAAATLTWRGKSVPEPTAKPKPSCSAGWLHESGFMAYAT